MPDSKGLLGVLDPNAYNPSVNDHRNRRSVLSHFDSEMSRRSLLLWATSAEDSWTIDLSTSPVDPGASIQMQARGPIVVTDGRLVVVNSEMLEIVAQCEADVTGPRWRVHRLCELWLLLELGR
ncbi:hypothetical protein ACIP5Y_46840 [Nocardia sp. NPDC088792]|uniref:hypothetical protein n=1 Tax=Nocardia sp. NPDC088792 TaxID=3364332 RepID=UPI0037FEC275